MSEFLDKERKKIVDENQKERHVKIEKTEEMIHEDEERMQQVLKDFDRESNTRHFEGVPMIVIKAMLIAFSVFVIWMNVFSTLPEQIRRASFIGIVIFMAFILYPVKKNHASKINKVPIYDFIMGIVGSGCFFYYVVNFQTIVDRAGRLTTPDMVVGIIGILILFEICRRVVGVPILVVVACFILYA